MSGVVLRLIFCVLCPGFVYISSDKGVCSKTNSTIKCCSNYKLNKPQTGCVECDVGYYQDCKTPCPDGWYGQLCETTCQCEARQCHHVTGCVDAVITKISSSRDGNCSGGTEDKCCLNYYWNRDKEKCLECQTGWYNHNCRDPCPFPYYGHLCTSECNCSNETCNHVTGCNNSNSYNTTIDRESKESDSNIDPQMTWIIVISACGTVVILAVIIGIICRCALSKSGIDYQPKHIQNSTRRQQASCENEHSVRRPCDSEQPLCHQEPVCGTPNDFYNDNLENPYAQITDTARLMPRTKHTPKEVPIPKAPMFQDLSSSQCEDSVPYDVLSLKIGSVNDLSSCDWSSPTAHWAKTCAPPPLIKNKPLPPLKRKSFLFPDDPSDYLEEKYVAGPSRSSEAEIKSLPTAPPPPTKIHQNGEIRSTKPVKKLPNPPKRTVSLTKKPDKLPRNPPRPPKKPSKDSSIYTGSGDSENPTISNGSVQNESTAERKPNTAHFMPNTVLKREKSLKATLQKDAVNKRKTNGKSYNLSGLLEVEDMPLPDFDEDREQEGSGSQDPLQNGAPPTNMFRKCQTVLKNKMNRISALNFAGNPLRYSFARPQNS